MVATRNQWTRNMWRGVNWNDEEEECCYMSFFDICQEKQQVDDPVVFNSIWPELARDVSKKLQKEFTIEKVRAKVHMFRCHFNMFLSYCQWTGVHLCRRWGTVTVKEDYYDISGRGDATKIDFGDDAVVELPGGDPDNPMVIDEDDTSSDTDSEGMSVDGFGGPMVAGGLGAPLLPSLIRWR
ncbi:hypothetical protein PHJA_001789500 [Phtheirospermum japonicum]|uniref:Uncharacterized protein n=1 Tax=Phtheirospermum japonicum TaxID=374723 RepID=A0A830CJJ7_9LAMI|nr:hypothetical protein PHJA_001789500 [Phtheirospermum japonicum]